MLGFAVRRLFVVSFLFIFFFVLVLLLVGLHPRATARGRESVRICMVYLLEILPSGARAGLLYLQPLSQEKKFFRDR